MRELWVWGAPQSIGIKIDDNDYFVPVDVDELVRKFSAGTNYTLFIWKMGVPLLTAT